MLTFILWVLSKLVLFRHRPFVVLITGAVGKTTTKDAIWRVLNESESERVRKSEKNLNTEIGLPLAILGGTPAGKSIAGWGKNIMRGVGVLFSLQYPDTLVLEVAADRPGDIKYLVSIVRPDIAVVTAIGEMPSHLEFFASREEYVREKSYVLSALKPGGTAVLNGDDATVWGMRSHVPEGRSVVRYGMDANADVRASDIAVHTPRSADEIETAGVSFNVQYEEGTVPFLIRGVLGDGIVYAALAAASVGVIRNLPLIRIREALLPFTPPKGRMTLRAGKKDIIILDDSYNASPLATTVALATLAQFEDRRKVAVLGDMKELGENEERAHREIGEEAVRAGDVVVFVGPVMKDAFEHVVARGAEEGGAVLWYKSAIAAARALSTVVHKGDVVLVKGSFSMEMRRVVSALSA